MTECMEFKPSCWTRPYITDEHKNTYHCDHQSPAFQPVTNRK